MGILTYNTNNNLNKKQNKTKQYKTKQNKKTKQKDSHFWPTGSLFVLN
jgi:hypothetical protein